LLDLASGSFPTGLYQDPKIDLPAQNFEPRSQLDSEVNARCESCDVSLIFSLIWLRCSGGVAKWTDRAADYG
jgi:hypothetical protein